MSQPREATMHPLSNVRIHHRYAPRRPRVGGAASAVAMTFIVAIVLIVLPAASSPADEGAVTLATITHAARSAFGLL
jgi:hypothetical protein